MGIERQDMRAMLRALKREMPAPSGRMLVLGDAVIHFTPADLRQLAAEEGMKLRELPAELTAFSLGKSLGFDETETLDINGRASINLDLQNTLPADLLARYDLVVDAGVLFWCFEPGTVLKNIFRLCKSGGLIFHITALSGYFGRGYYNVHPRLFEDFYLSNQCVFVQSSFRAKPRPTRTGRLAGKFSRFLRPPTDGTKTTYSDTPGAIYLDSATREHFKFAARLPTREAEVIPNNGVSTFACRKTGTLEPQGPLQIC